MLEKEHKNVQLNISNSCKTLTSIMNKIKNK